MFALLKKAKQINIVDYSHETNKNLSYFLVAINLNKLQMLTNFDYKSSFWHSVLVS